MTKEKENEEKRKKRKIREWWETKLALLLVFSCSGEKNLNI